MSNRRSNSWRLKSFIDSFILELDKAQDTLAIKGMNQPLTYTVKDISLDLQLFPDFDGQQVRFANAKPGESGASKISIQLGSITDRQIRQITKPPVGVDDLHIEEVEELDQETKDSLRKIGVTSVKDIERLEAKKVDISKAPVFDQKTGGFQNLADKLKQLKTKKQELVKHLSRRDKRQQLPPRINGINKVMNDQIIYLNIVGENLALTNGFQAVALLNEQPIEVVQQDKNKIRIKANSALFKLDQNEVRIALDPYSVLKFTV